MQQAPFQVSNPTPMNTAPMSGLVVNEFNPEHLQMMEQNEGLDEDQLQMIINKMEKNQSELLQTVTKNQTELLHNFTENIKLICSNDKDIIREMSANSDNVLKALISMHNENNKESSQARKVLEVQQANQIELLKMQMEMQKQQNENIATILSQLTERKERRAPRVKPISNSSSNNDAAPHVAVHDPFIHRRLNLNAYLKDNSKITVGNHSVDIKCLFKFILEFGLRTDCGTVFIGTATIPNNMDEKKVYFHPLDMWIARNVAMTFQAVHVDIQKKQKENQVSIHNFILPYLEAVEFLCAVDPVDVRNAMLKGHVMEEHSFLLNQCRNVNWSETWNRMGLCRNFKFIPTAQNQIMDDVLLMKTDTLIDLTCQVGACLVSSISKMEQSFLVDGNGNRKQGSVYVDTIPDKILAFCFFKSTKIQLYKDNYSSHFDYAPFKAAMTKMDDNSITSFLHSPLPLFLRWSAIHLKTFFKNYMEAFKSWQDSSRTKNVFAVQLFKHKDDVKLKTIPCYSNAMEDLDWFLGSHKKFARTPKYNEKSFLKDFFQRIFKCGFLHHPFSFLAAANKIDTIDLLKFLSSKKIFEVNDNDLMGADDAIHEVPDDDSDEDEEEDDSDEDEDEEDTGAGDEIPLVEEIPLGPTSPLPIEATSPKPLLPRKNVRMVIGKKVPRYQEPPRKESPKQQQKSTNLPNKGKRRMASTNTQNKKIKNVHPVYSKNDIPSSPL